MNSDIYSLINKIQDFFKEKNIETLKNSFNKKIYREISESGEMPIETNDTLGVFHFYNSDEEKHYSVKFETELDEIVNKLLSKTKIEIERIIDHYNSNKTSIIIQNSFKYIFKTEEKLFLSFPNCYDSLVEFSHYFNSKYNLSINLDRNKSIDYFNLSQFKIKDNYTSKKIYISLYDLAINYDIIDDELVSENDFIAAITGSVKSKPIRFNTSTGIISSFLSSISQVFIDFNGKVIENSKMFLTKKGEILTQSNYNKSKSTLSNKKRELSLSINNEIEKILESHSK